MRWPIRTIRGPIDYAGLERATGVRKDDTRSDIYFLGCIYYHMLTGKPPIVRNARPHPTAEQEPFQEVVPILEVDPDCPSDRDVVNQAMELDPSDRYQTPGEMLVDLKAAMQQLERPRRGDGDDEEEPAKRPRCPRSARRSAR